MEVGSDLRQVEGQPVKAPRLDLEIEVGIFLAMHGDDAVGLNDGGHDETERLDGPGDWRADGARDDHGLGRAEAVGEIDFLDVEIGDEAVGVELPAVAQQAGGLELQDLVRVKDAGLEAAGRFAAKSEIGQGHTPPDAELFCVAAPAPDLGFDHGRLGEGEEIQGALFGQGPGAGGRRAGPRCRRAGSRIVW